MKNHVPIRCASRMAGLLLSACLLTTGTWGQCFQGVVYHPVGDTPGSVAVGDFNGDGKDDLATADYYSNGISVLLNNGNGSFALSGYRANRPIAVRVGDFNGDGKPDLVTDDVGDDSVSVLLNNGDGTFAPRLKSAAGDGPGAIEVGDFNGDTKPDLAVSSFYTNSVTVLLGNGNGTFAAPVNYAVDDAPGTITAGDFNADGKPDLATEGVNRPNVSVLLNNGDGTFAAAQTFGLGGYVSSVAAGDFNADGKADLIVTSYSNENKVSLFLSNGDGTFRTGFVSGVPSPFAAVVADFNIDGILDLAVSQFYDGHISVRLGTGNGNFRADRDFRVGAVYPIELAVGDFNSDGKPDIAVAMQALDRVAVLINSATATFTATDAGICPGQSLDLATTVGNFNPTGGTLSYHASLADAKANTNPLPSSTVSPLVTTTYFVRYATGGDCGTVTVKAVSVTINPTTGTPGFSNPTLTLCQNAANTTYTATAVNSTSIAYSLSPAGAGSIDVSSGEVDWNAAFTGQATVTASTTGLCGTTSAEAVVTVNPLTGTPSFNNPTLTVCQNAANTTYTASALNSTAITYSLSPAEAGSIGATTGEVDWNASFSGQATITATASGLCGTTSAEAVVTINPSTGTPVFSSSTLTLCQNAANTTYMATAANSTSILYSLSPAGAGSIDASSGEVNWNVAFSGQATVTATASGLCGTTSAEAIVTINPDTGTTSFSNPTLTLCQNAANTTYTATAVNSTSITYSLLPAEAGSINASSGDVDWNAAFSGQATITATASGLCGTSSAEAVVTVNPNPTEQTLTGGGTFCESDAGAVIGLGGWQSGVIYQLLVQDAGLQPVGAAVTGNGAALSFALLTRGGTFSVRATDPATTCQRLLTGSVSVTLNHRPLERTVSGGGTYCAGSGGVTIQVVASETGISYQLLNGSANPVGAAVTGTGATIGFDPVLAGSYTVRATNPAGGCQRTLTGSQAVSPAQPVFTQAATLNTTSVCAGQTLTLNFNINCPTNASFSAELSDASGRFSSYIFPGTVTPGSANILIIPAGTVAGSGYKIRVNATNPALNSSTTAFSVVTPSFTSTPTVSGVPICAGLPVTVGFSTVCPAGSMFRIELSNASGSFATAPGVPTLLGNHPTGGASVLIPGNVAAGSSYRIRIVSPGGGPVSNSSGAFRIRACNGRLASDASAELGGLQVSVKPNPTEGLLRITIQGAVGQALTIELFNGAGQRLRQKEVKNALAEESLSWNIDRQPAGLYLLRVSTANESQTVKLVR
ncbi:MAG: FG-GAP-like repeat-containing protein [Cytophagaceae bacterium]|nr:FG-GAP-like repeat-containing protein [Cytophagaceae bacterium]